MIRWTDSVLVLVIALVASPSAHADACVSLLADLQGLVSVSDSTSAAPAARWPAQLLQCLPVRKVLWLETGTRATLFYAAQRTSMELRGPGKFVVEALTARPLNDSPAPIRTLLSAAFSDIKLDRSHLLRAGVRMRDPIAEEGPRPIAPLGIVTSEDPIKFSWKPGNTHPPYRLRVTHANKVGIFEAVTDGMELSLPAEVKMVSGERLLWQVEPVASPGTSAMRWQEFVIPTPEGRKLAAIIDRDVPSPTPAERNLRFVLLMQRMSPAQ